MKTNEKNIDAVRLMREIRDKLTEKYLANPEQEMIDLERIRKKYHLRERVK